MSRRKQIKDRAVDKGDDVRLHIDSLVSSLKAMVSSELLMSPDCCIFKIPVTHIRYNKNAFIPNAFSIGHLYHGKRNLKVTEKIKVRYLQDLISRSPSPEAMLSSMVNSITEVEKEAREYYAAPIQCDQIELVKILIIEGCFIIELLRKYAVWELGKYADPIFSMSCMRSFLHHDLILLENQVPWMVLERLFNLTKDPSRELPLVTLATKYLENFFPSYTIDPLSDSCIKIEGIKHFVDLLRLLSTARSTDHPPVQSIKSEGTNHFVHLFRKLSTLPSTLFMQLSTLSSTLFKKWSRSSSSTEERDEGWGWEQVPSATSLVEAGIKFERHTSRSILDIKFEHGVLKIPPFQIDDKTETLFRNLICYEQCLPHCDDEFTSYVIFLDYLIITIKDMNILCENKIIENYSNAEDATELFNKLALDTVVDYCHRDVSKHINRFCKRHYPLAFSFLSVVKNSVFQIICYFLFFFIDYYLRKCCHFFLKKNLLLCFFFFFYHNKCCLSVIYFPSFSLNIYLKKKN